MPVLARGPDPGTGRTPVPAGAEWPAPRATARLVPAALLAAAVLVPLPVLVPLQGSLGAQELERRVRAEDGRVAFHFAIREGVEVCEDGAVRRTDSGGTMRWEWRGSGSEPVCSTGLAELVVTVDGGSVRRLGLEPWEGDGSTVAGVRSLGRVAAGDAAGFLVSLARSGRDHREAAEDGLTAAAMADSVQVWPELLAVARDGSLDADLREAAVFWLGRAAGDVVTAELAELARDEEEEQDVREAAVFALSRRPDEESVPLLIDLARSAREPGTRRAALFWLARSDDERVVPFFEEILLGGSPGG